MGFSERKHEMSAHLPPVPDENRSHKGAGETKRMELQREHPAQTETENPDKLGHQGNTIINTPYRRFVQDR